MQENTYIAIDLKSFYASVECVERGLNPMTTNLVVADNRRTEKTICLAVSPSLKKYGIPGRARLYEVVQKAKQANIDFIIAPPRMAYYMKYSTRIYNIYLKYFAPEDIFAYSIDEVFCDVTHYLKTYKMTARQLVTKVMLDVLKTTGITATAGIGTNLYLAKVAMDIGAKHIKPDKNGVRIAELDEMSYRKLLWNYRPITDFWRVGKGYAKKLEKYRIYTMGDIARTSLRNEDLLYKLFGVNAELLIDHSWGWECATIKSIKNYKPMTNSISSGQVLHCAYDYEKTKLIVKEMTELLTLDLVKKNLVTSQLILTIGYDVDNLIYGYDGEITLDQYGRKVPKHAHGTINLDYKTSSTKIITEAVMELYDRIINNKLLARRINVTANNVVSAEQVHEYEQINLFTDYKKRQKEEGERKIQKAMLDIKNKYGKNAIIKGMNLQAGGTTIERNSQIGGHRA